MRNTKAANIFKKFFSATLLVLLILSAFAVFGCSNKQADVLSYNATSNQKALYEVDVLYNVVILTDLSRSNEKFSGSDYEKIDKAFNDTTDSNVKSLREYFREESKHRKNKDGTPQNPLDIISVYMFCNSSMSGQAFKDMDKDDPNNTKKDQIAFVSNALNGKIYWDVNGQHEFTGNLDANNDGLIDSVTVYVPLSITNDDGNTAAWPHTILGNSAFNHTFKDLKYDRFVISSYIINGYSAQVGVLCHEMLHNIGNYAGVQDLYHYEDKNDSNFGKLIPVGNYCIMASTDYNNPQPLNIYYKSKLGWAELEEISGNGNSNILKEENKAVKFGVKGSEFFIAQYWPENSYNKNTRTGNSYSKDPGIIIYRVNTAITTGNMYKKVAEGGYTVSDEIYIVRNNSLIETSQNFPAVFSNGESCEKLTYSDGKSANIIVKIEIGTNDFKVFIESYNVTFKIKNAAGDWEIVPYEIAVQLEGKEKEETFSGVYVFSFEEDYMAGKKLNFDCYGYRFYAEEGNLTGEGIFSIFLRNYTLDDEHFTITVYVVAKPRDVTVNFRDFEGNTLMLNLSGIDFALCEHDGTLKLKETLSLANFSGNFFGDKQVKNGDFIYFILQIRNDRYKTEILEITPDVKTEANIRLKKLCTMEGIVASKGTPLKEVIITIEGKENIKFFIDDIECAEVNFIDFSIEGNKYTFSFDDTMPNIIGYTDADGKFKLENVPQGAKITFELENYQSGSHTVTQDNLNLSINLIHSSESSLIVIIIACVIIGIIIIATLISVLVSQKRHSYKTNEHYDE